MSILRRMGAWRWWWWLGCVGVSPGVAATYHVTTNGLDAADGMTVETAFRTIQQAANLAGPGDRVLVHEGTYREYLAFPHSGEEGNPVQLMAAEGSQPVVAGSEVVTNWVRWQDDIWMVPDWPIDPQQVFDNGRPVTKLGWPNLYFVEFPNRYFGEAEKGLEDLRPNTFFYDETNLVLYLWLENDASPEDRTVEVSTRLGLINTRNLWGFTNAWYDVRGLAFRHCNTLTHSEFGWPGVWLSDDSRLEGCRIEWCDAAGFSLGDHTEAIDCEVNDNGINGGAAARDFEITRCRFLRNNYRRFSPFWTAAAMKFIPDLHGTVQDCEIAYNQCPAVWFDSCATGEPIVIRRNYIHHNTDIGIFIEISKNASIYNNLIVSNWNRSIYISSSENTQVFNNTIVDHQSWMTVEMFFTRGRTNSAGEVFRLANNRFANNIIYGSRALRDLVMFADDPPYCTNNTSDYNCIYRPEGARFIVNRSGASGSVYSSLAAFQNETSWDAHSLSLDPMFVNPAVGNYHLSSSEGVYSNGIWTVTNDDSPGIDTGDPRSIFQDEPGPNGGRINMGRYGNTDEASLSADADGDGVSDVIERILLHSNPDAVDSDADNVPDFGEYVAGTDLNDADSQLRLSLTPVAGSEPRRHELSWFGVRDRRYELLSSSSLDHSPWQRHTQWMVGVAPTIAEWAGTNGIIRVVEDPAQGDASRFYRLRVRWP